MNNRIEIVKEEVLSDNKYPLKKITFNYCKQDDSWQTEDLEVYAKGDAATAMLYNRQNKTVIFTKQFRLPSFLNGNKTGMLIETCAGMLDNDEPEKGIKREIEEETGYRVPAVKKIMEAYMSPGSLTEKLYFFIAEYTEEMKKSKGGGVDKDEDIEVMELPFKEAIRLLSNGEIYDAKTIILIQYAQLNKLLE